MKHGKAKGIKMIQNIISKIGTDKLLHISVSMVLTLELRRFLPCWQAVLIVLTIGIAKEVYDKISGKGTPEWKDIIADIVGIALGSI